MFRSISTRAARLGPALSLLALAATAQAQTGGHGSFEPPVLDDVHPAQAIVQVNLTAAPTTVQFMQGVPTAVYAYNGTVPGPTIEANVGDTLIVDFTNNLPEPTNIHWHGVDVPANMDGSNISQVAVPPGGQFRYEFELTREGLFWYHPHENTNEQVERGLHGALLVKGPDDGNVNIPPRRDMVWFIDDILLDPTGQIAPFASDLSNPMSPEVRAEEIANSRPGNTFLVNGRVNPIMRVVDGRPIRLRIINPANGRYMRLSSPGMRMIHIAGDAGFHEQITVIPPVTTIIDPLLGQISNPAPTQGLLIPPSARVEIVLLPKGQPGDFATLQWHDFPLGLHKGILNPDGTVFLGDKLPTDPPVDLVTFFFVPGVGNGWSPTLPLRSQPITPINSPPVPDRMLVPFGHTPPASDGSITFFNAVGDQAGMLADLDALLAQAEDPNIVGPIPGMVMPPMYMPQPFPVLQPADAHTAEVGDIKEWYVVNFTHMAHPFHTHGFPFQPLEIIAVDLDRQTAAQRVLRRPIPLEIADTFSVPQRRGGPIGRSWTILRCAVQFDDSLNTFGLMRTPQQLIASGKVPVTNNPLDPLEGTSGGWLAHCHMLEHSKNGMLNFLQLFLPSPDSGD